MSKDQARSHAVQKPRGDFPSPAESMRAEPGSGHRPVESEVAFLFAFALGVLSGAHAARRTTVPTEFGELPQGFSLAGGKLDTLAGDAILAAGGKWYLLEMKRGYREFADEFDKPRVRAMQAKLQAFAEVGRWNQPWQTARTAHQFLYLGVPSSKKLPELASLNYLDWLRQPGRKTHIDWKRESMPFTYFVSKAGKDIPGFSREQLAEYIAQMNEIEGSAGGLTRDDISGRLAVAIDTSGVAALRTYESLCSEFSINIPRTPGSADVDPTEDSELQEQHRGLRPRMT